MKKAIYRWWHLAALLVALVAVWCVMEIPGAGEWYAQAVYPGVSAVLSRISAVFPFSVGDCFIYGSIAGLVVWLIYALWKRKSFWLTVACMAEYLAWVYVWFYMAWGLNYFRDDFFSRTQTPPAAYEKAEFQTFLTAYTDSLNAAYCEVDLDEATVDREVKAGYHSLSPALHIRTPGSYLRAKSMLVSPLMSSVGVIGYINPFLTEFNLNRDLLPIQYPSTYAHEMAHVLGVSNEAEANLCAYLICTRSSLPEMRFSGYFGLLSYVLSNAYMSLSDNELEAWKETLRPEVCQLYNDKVAHWQSLYNPWIGKVQDLTYNLYLKGNNIPSGTANYSEVIALLISYGRGKSLL